MGSNADAIAPYRIGFDVSGFFCMSQTALRGYIDNWNTFNRIQTSNILVSTANAVARTTGGQIQTYHQFQNFTERGQFTNGRMLHIRRYPNSNWDVVAEN